MAVTWTATAPRAEVMVSLVENALDSTWTSGWADFGFASRGMCGSDEGPQAKLSQAGPHRQGNHLTSAWRNLAAGSDGVPARIETACSPEPSQKARYRMQLLTAVRAEQLLISLAFLPLLTQATKSTLTSGTLATRLSCSGTMFKNHDLLKGKLSQISAKTLSLGGTQYMLARNELKIRYHEAYEHDALSSPRSFRLLRVLPGGNIDVISVELFEVSLDDKPHFDALSYSWTLDPTMHVSLEDVLKKVEHVKDERRPILCNGKTLHITMNLYHALAELRRSKLQLPVWADQVCINQEHEKEKVAQLAIMTQIYTSASTVLIWLGSNNTIRNWALDFMEALPDHAPITSTVDNASARPKSSAVSMLSKAQDTVNALTSVSKSAGDSMHWLAVLTILTRQWFERIWTLQELLLAQKVKVIMGSREVEVKTIQKAIEHALQFFATNSFSVQYGINSASIFLQSMLPSRAALFEKQRQYHSGKKYTAEEYLRVARVRKSTEAKDKVFAGAALLENGVPESVTYFSTTRDIFYAFAVERLWPEVGLKSLALVGGCQTMVEGLPSWIPDLSVRMRPAPLGNCRSPKFQSLIGGALESYRIDGSALHLQARKWSSVKQIGESIWSWVSYDIEPYNPDGSLKMQTSTTASHERFGLMFALLNDWDDVYTPTGEPTFDAFWNTLIAGVASTHEESTDIWRDRFCQYFVFTLMQVKSHLKYARGKSRPKTWSIPLIQDLPHMEERVSKFLASQNQVIGDGDTQRNRLEKLIEIMETRVFGDVEAEAKGWRTGFGEALAAGRQEEFYTPVSIFARLFHTTYDGRRIFTTENGFLGIGSEGVKQGDEIFLVAGADVPYVFRPVNDTSGATFTLVGEAYIHGLSGGNIGTTELASSTIRVI